MRIYVYAFVDPSPRLRHGDEIGNSVVTVVRELRSVFTKKAEALKAGTCRVTRARATRAGQSGALDPR